MNPEAIDTLVVDTTTSNDFEELSEDPLADPLLITETQEILCAVKNTKNDENDQILLIDVQSLKNKETDVEIEEIVENATKTTTKKPEKLVKEPVKMEPSCSYRDEHDEFEDFEDLIESSRIFCRSPIHVAEVSNDTNEDSVTVSDEVENVCVTKKCETHKFDEMSFFEDFEDQIEQSILNKSELSTSIEVKKHDNDDLKVKEQEMMISKPEARVCKPKVTLSQLEISAPEPKVTISPPELNETISGPEVILSKPEMRVCEPEMALPEPKMTLSRTEVKAPQPEITLSKSEVRACEPQVTYSQTDVTIASNEKDEKSSIIASNVKNIAQTDICETKTVIKEKIDEKEIICQISEQTPPEVVIECAATQVIESNNELEAFNAVTEECSLVVESIDVIQSIPPIASNEVTENERRDEEDGGRSDGSDSGLGSEPSNCLTNSVAEKSVALRLPDPPAKGNLKRRSSEQIDGSNAIETKRSKKGIQFEGVTVYSFPRQQGFSCVPSQGGCTLGMANQHCNVKYYTLTEHSAEQRRNHRQQLSDMNPRSSSSDDSDSEYEPTDSSSEADSEVYGFLQPVSARQRRALLKLAGVRKIDVNEKDECKMIRTSREVCGCTCRVFCDPDTCACSQAGIKCQVDRPNFPCGCTREGCGNVVGRVEFSPMRVRTHYIHTVMKLQMENKQERLRSSTNAASNASNNNYKAWQVQQQQQQQSNMRQVPSSSSSCVVDSIAAVEQSSQPQQLCDFSLIYDNHGSIVVPDVQTSYTYQSNNNETSTSSYANHIIENVPKPSSSSSSSSYHPSTSNYDPNFMTPMYVEQQQPPSQQYMQETVYYETNSCMQNTYQLHSYEIPNHHPYAMQSYQSTSVYNQYPTSSSSTTLNYLQSPTLTSPMPPINDILLRQTTTTHHDHIYGYNPSNAIMYQTSNYSETPHQTKPLILENNLPTSSASTSQNQSQNATNENLCEIIKKGIVETVSG